MSTHKWKKIERGFYVLEGTPFAVASTWKQASASYEDRTGIVDLTGVEWTVVKFRSADEADRDSQGGENINWYDTMREARAEAERLAEADRRRQLLRERDEREATR